METGIGIAIAGVWIFAGMSLLSKDTPGAGRLIAIILACIVTLLLR